MNALEYRKTAMTYFVERRDFACARLDRHDIYSIDNVNATFLKYGCADMRVFIAVFVAPLSSMLFHASIIFAINRTKIPTI